MVELPKCFEKKQKLIPDKYGWEDYYYTGKARLERLKLIKKEKNKLFL